MSDNTNHEILLLKIEGVHEDVRGIQKAVAKQNGRVRKLENKYNYFIGALSILAVVGSVLWKVL